MVKDNDIPNIPGYVSVKEAARLLGVSASRMYEYIRERRLPLHKAGKAYMIPVEALKDFKPNPTGRLRTKPPEWRIYHGGGTVLATDIQVQVRTGQQGRLTEKLKAIQEGKRHTFPGTIARYVLKDRSSFTKVTIWLIWKDTEMPNAGTREQDLLAFQEEFADVLDWETAQYSTGEAIIHT